MKVHQVLKISFFYHKSRCIRADLNLLNICLLLTSNSTVSSSMPINLTYHQNESSVNQLQPEDVVNNILYKAIYMGNVEVVEKIVDSYGLSYSPLWDEGYELLLTAIECMYVDVAKLLITKGCKLVTCKQSEKILHQAIKLGNLEVISMILDRDKQNPMKLKQEEVMLHVAITEDKVVVARMLLQRGADIEARNDSGMTPLQVAALCGPIEILELLLVSGADIESQDINGKTSLFHAVSSGHQPAVKTLLKHGANFNCQNKNGVTPLMDATTKGYSEIVIDLINNGADIDCKNNLGQTPLHIACLLKNKRLTSELLRSGADVNVVDCNGMVACDAIKKKNVSSNTFEHPVICCLFGKHLTVLKLGGFYLNNQVESFYQTFHDIYLKEIRSGDVVVSQSAMMYYTIQTCQQEINIMKGKKSDLGFTMYDIFKKWKNPLSTPTKSEIHFIEENKLENFICFEGILRCLLKSAKIRNELQSTAGGLLRLIFCSSRNNLPVLPEEVWAHVLNYLTKDELKHLIKCSEKIHMQNTYEDE